MFSIASVDESNEVYLTRQTYISIIDRLLKPSGYVAVIRTTLTDPGTIIAQVEYSTDAQKELYYIGDAVAELCKKIFGTKYKWEQNFATYEIC